MLCHLKYTSLKKKKKKGYSLSTHTLSFFSSLHPISLSLSLSLTHTHTHTRSYPVRHHSLWHQWSLSHLPCCPSHLSLSLFLFHSIQRHFLGFLLPSCSLSWAKLWASNSCLAWKSKVTSKYSSSLELPSVYTISKNPNDALYDLMFPAKTPKLVIPLCPELSFLGIFGSLVMIVARFVSFLWSCLVPVKREE